MVIWINGAFGSGKTQTAFELHRRLPGSFVYDPENVGYWMRKNEPASLQRGNFQDEPLWRSVNFDMLSHLASHFDGPIIVPMTITDVRYYDEIIGRLRQSGVDVRHFLLSVNEQTIRKRLRKRMELSNSWAYQHYHGCVAVFQNPRFENKIQTDHLSISEAAEQIADALPLPLLPRAGAFRRRWQRLRTQLGVLRK